MSTERNGFALTIAGATVMVVLSLFVNVAWHTANEGKNEARIAKDIAYNINLDYTAFKSNVGANISNLSNEINKTREGIEKLNDKMDKLKESLAKLSRETKKRGAYDDR